MIVDYVAPVIAGLAAYGIVRLVWGLDHYPALVCAMIFTLVVTYVMVS